MILPPPRPFGCNLLHLKDLNVAVVLVNQCMSDPGAMAMFATVKPVGGHVLAHASTTRVHLKKGRVRHIIRRGPEGIRKLALTRVNYFDHAVRA